MEHITTIPNFKEWLSSLGTLYTINAQVKPDGIEICQADTANICFVHITNKMICSKEIVLQFDVNELKSIKGDVAELNIDGNKVVFKCGSTKYTLPITCDPTIKTKESLPIKWPHEVVNLTIENVKEIYDIAKNEKEYAFNLKNHIITVDDCVKDKLATCVEFECPNDGELYTKVKGDYLKDIFTSYKAYTTHQMLLGNNTPLGFIFSSENLNAKYLISPMIEPQN
jgi:hypothetical protein